METSTPGSVVASLPAWQQRTFPLAIMLLRVTFGLLFLANGIAKLPGFKDLDYAPFPGFLISYDGARNSLASDTKSHPIGVYKEFVDDVILDNFSLFGPLLVVTEIGVGLLLVAGAFSSAAALIGFLSLFHIWFANWDDTEIAPFGRGRARSNGSRCLRSVSSPPDALRHGPVRRATPASSPKKMAIRGLASRGLAREGPQRPPNG